MFTLIIWLHYKILVFFLRNVVCVQTEDDLAEKMRSNEMLLKAVNTYKEVAELPDVPPDLIKATLKSNADRQQFLGTVYKLMYLNPKY